MRPDDGVVWDEVRESRGMLVGGEERRTEDSGRGDYR